MNTKLLTTLWPFDCTIQVKARNNVSVYPLWVHGPWGSIGVIVVALAAMTMAAPVTTAFEWGIGWALVAVGEVVLGAAVVAFFPTGFRFIIALIGSIISVVIMGAILRFWYV